MHIQVSSTVEALIRGGLNLAERRFTSNSSMFFPFFNISPTGPRTCSILPSNMIHLLFHVVALLCPQCNNASQKSSHRKKRLSTAEWYPLNNPHKPKTCGKDQASVFKSWGGDYEKVLIGHFWLTVSDGALFFFFFSLRGFLILVWAFRCMPRHINLLQMKGGKLLRSI